ncbi:MAG: CARDB domain-containing protein, partial [Solirubrobacterales bacterium]
RISVNAGDRFGATSASPSFQYLAGFAGPAQDFCFYFLSPHALGESHTYFSSSCNNFVPLVEGSLEADADGDLFGDETQDLCPTDATRQTPCPIVVCGSPCQPPSLPANLVITPVKSKAKPGSAATRSFLVKNIGASAATPVTFSLSSSKKVKKFTFVKGCKSAKGGKSCAIASIAPGASVTIKVKVTPKASSSTKLTAKVTTPGETSRTDNSASTTVKFKLKK